MIRLRWGVRRPSHSARSTPPPAVGLAPGVVSLLGECVPVITRPPRHNCDGEAELSGGGVLPAGAGSPPEVV